MIYFFEENIRTGKTCLYIFSERYYKASGDSTKASVASNYYKAILISRKQAKLLIKLGAINRIFTIIKPHKLMAVNRSYKL